MKRSPSATWFLTALAALLCAVAVMSAAPVAPVRVWQGTLQIPTYAEGPANPNPPFDLFSYGRFNYPYPNRDALTDRREPVAWRTLNLENEYLRLTVLPDLGGHLQLPRQAQRATDVLCEHRDQEGTHRLSRRMGGVWCRVQLPCLSQLDVDVPGRRRHDGTPGRERIDLGWQCRSGLRLALEGRAAARAGPVAPGAEGRSLQREPCQTSLLLVEQRRGAGLGRLASRLPDGIDGHARVHANRALAG